MQVNAIVGLVLALVLVHVIVLIIIVIASVLVLVVVGVVVVLSVCFFPKSISDAMGSCLIGAFRDGSVAFIGADGVALVGFGLRALPDGDRVG